MLQVMKRFFAASLALALVLSLLPGLNTVSAAQYSGTCGASVSWTLDTVTGVLDITGTGDMSNYTIVPAGTTSTAPWAAYGADIKTVNISSGVTSIGGFAFSYCTSLTGIVIPDSIINIGNYAFFECSNLTSVVIPDNVTSIEDAAFYNCTSLTGVVIPDSVISIGNYAFFECTSLTGIVIPDSVTSIGDSVFSYCSSLTGVAIPDSVTSIGYAAFAHCTSLAGVVIPNSVTSIGDYMFYNCTSLTGATFEGNTPDTFGKGVFDSTASGFTIYHYPGKTGWPSVSPGTWNGYKTEMLGSAPSFIPVASISGVPNTAVANTPLTLSGVVNPSNATNQAITWSIVNTGTTGAAISGNTLNTSAAGTVTVRATVVNGMTASSNYTQDFTITVGGSGASLPDGQYTVLVLDISGSMGGSAMTAMKKAAIAFCKNLLQGTGSCGNTKNYIALVSFSSSSNIEQDFTDDINILTSKINALIAGGVTNYDPALQDAQTLLSVVTGSNSIKNVVFMSDGEPHDFAAAKTTADKLIDDGCNIYTLGFFHGGLNPTAESRLKDIQNRGYYFVDDANELDQIFGKLGTDICTGGSSSPSGIERYVSLVLDMSGSMRGTPLQELKKTAKRFCDSMMKADGKNYISIVTYNTTGKKECSFTDDLNILYAVIDGLAESGQTNTNKGLEIAGQMMDEISGGSNVIKNIVLMSDGLPNSGTSMVTGKYVIKDNTYYAYANAAYNTARSLKMKGYNIYTLGFFHSIIQSGELKNDPTALKFAIRFMDDLQSHGTRTVQRAEDLDFAFGQIGALLLNTSNPRTVLRIECPVEFTVSYEGETLSSFLDIDSINLVTSWGNIDFTDDEMQKKAVTLYTSKPVEVEINGTGEGTMNYSVENFDPFGNLSSSNAINNVPVKYGTLINTKSDKYTDPVLLYDFDGDGNTKIINVPQNIVETGDQPSYWAQADIARAISSSLVPSYLRSKYTQIITRAEFCALAVALYEMYLGSEIKGRASFTDTNDINAEKAGFIGIVLGVGDGRFSPNSGLTREQAATILSRLSNSLGQPLPGYTTSFSDYTNISPWAIDSVGQVQFAEIMQGVGGNRFSPKTAYTREQSITTILRLYDRVM